MSIRKSQGYKPKTAAEDKLQRSHATKILNTINVVVKNTIASVENLKVDTVRETIALLTETNSFANDLQALVHRLTRIVIKSFKNGRSNQDVAQVAKNLSNYVYSIQTSYHTEIDILKRVLKSGLEGASTEAHQLHNLLQTETTYATNIINIIFDILFAIRKVYYRNLYQTMPQDEFTKVIPILKNRFVGAIINATKEDDATMNNFVRLVFHADTRIALTIRTIDEESEGYTGKTKSDLGEIAASLSSDLATITNNALRFKDEPETLKEYVKMYGVSVRYGMMALIGLNNPNSPDKNIAINLNNLILLVTAHHSAMGDELVEGIEYINQAS